MLKEKKKERTGKIEKQKWEERKKERQTKITRKKELEKTWKRSLSGLLHICIKSILH